MTTELGAAPRETPLAPDVISQIAKTVGPSVVSINADITSSGSDIFGSPTSSHAAAG